MTMRVLFQLEMLEFFILFTQVEIKEEVPFTQPVRRS